MRLTRTVATFSLILGSLAAFTACGSGDQTATVPLRASASASGDPIGATLDASASATTSSAGVTSYPEIGLSFADLPSVSGARQTALRTWMDFEVAVRRTVTTLKLDPAIGRIDPAMVPHAKAAVAYLKAHHQRFGGEEKARFLKVIGDRGTLMVFDVCLDSAQARIESTNGGTSTPVDPATEKVRVEMSQVAGAWKISSHETVGTC